MTGRDHHSFITSLRAEDTEKLTLRMKNGLCSSKYKPAEYKQLQAIVDATHRECDIIGQKIQKTRCAAKATKESSMLRQHKQVWCREGPRLKKAEEKAENDIRDFLEQIRPNSRTDTAIFSLQDYEMVLQREREAFWTATIEPVQQLKDDLSFRLGEVQHQQFTAHHADWEQVLQQIHFVKEQQDGIIARLDTECLALEDEINALGLEKYHSSTSDDLMKIDIPKEILDSECPYPELKESLIWAFHSLSERYQCRLESLQQQLQKIDRFCGWCANDHYRFQFTLSQYTHDIPSHRVLYLDMIQRLFPQKTRQELAEHERVWDWQCFTQEQLRVLAHQWQRDHWELLARGLVTLEEARNAHYEEMEFRKDRQHQQDICSHLREKLLQLRAQQEEVAKLEAVIAGRQQEEEEARLKRERETETAIRLQQKDKIRQFYLKQKKRMELVEQRDQERLASLRSMMEEQARRDKERVLFRADMLQRRKDEREIQELVRQKEEEEKQKNLDALRNQVVVQAVADPDRMMSHTQAWKSRQSNGQEFELQRPLYNINTYTDTQIVSDPRVRVEQALREAGLHHSQYAREVLSIIKPPKPPRRDTIHNQS